MKRIVLIGNGFDLAHGMKTSYKNFVDDLWAKLVQKINTADPGPYDSDLIRIINLPTGFNCENNYSSLQQSLRTFNQGISFKNKFLKIITGKSTLHSWVDIENEYYALLKDTYKNPRSTIKIDELNSDFEQIKTALKNYLDEVEDSFENSPLNIHLKNRIEDIVFSAFKLKDFCEQSINQKLDEEYDSIKKDIDALSNDLIDIQELSDDKRKIIARLGYDKTKGKLRQLLLSNQAHNYFKLEPSEILFLNFNYTSTENQYNNHPSIPTKSIHIHGSLNPEDKNPIIFGFGDELDEDYKSIEDLNENKYLENIKSIRYLETDNYKELLEYVNSGPYQVFTFGHSCGISDRTLLNTIFEHNNCVSVKPYYYQISESHDNYSDIVRNISRNFNNKVVMRDKVVNKNYCETLSQ